MFENSFSQKRMKPSIKLHKSEQTLLLRKFSVLLSQWIFNDWILFYLLLVFEQLHSWLVTEVQTLRSCLSMLRSSLRVRIKCPIQMQAIGDWALLHATLHYLQNTLNAKQLTDIWLLFSMQRGRRWWFLWDAIRQEGTLLWLPRDGEVPSWRGRCGVLPHPRRPGELRRAL